jgi:hypothetical protein
MSLAAHQAAVTPAPTCPGCGDPMAPTPAGHHTCSCDGTTPAPYDLPRGHDRPMRTRERRIRTTTAVDVWPGYQPPAPPMPVGATATARRRKRT